MHRLTKLFLALALVMSVGGLTAGSINFDTATGGLPYASELSDDGILVSFYSGTGSCNPAGTCPLSLTGTTHGADPGNGSQEGFEVDDTRSVGPQTNLLTDEGGPPNLLALDYFFLFAVGIPDLSLDLLDFRVDGGALAGATAILEVFASDDWSGAALGSSSFITTGAEPNGNVQNLSVSGVGAIRTARVSFTPSIDGGTADLGTGIDNLEWTTAAVPEPGTVVLFGSGLLALAALARKRRARA